MKGAAGQALMYVIRIGRTRADRIDQGLQLRFDLTIGYRRNALAISHGIDGFIFTIQDVDAILAINVIHPDPDIAIDPVPIDTFLVQLDYGIFPDCNDFLLDGEFIKAAAKRKLRRPY